MKQSLQLRTSQHLALTPQLQQSIRLLQLSTLELQQEIEQIMQNNPLLERLDDPLDHSLRLLADGAINPAPASTSTPAPAEHESTPEVEVDGASFESADSGDADGGSAEWDFDGAARPDKSPDDENSRPQLEAPELTLRDHLQEQVRLNVRGQREQALLTVLIDAIDDNGFLSEPLEDILSWLPPELDISLEELAAALATLQGFDPVGVGARTVSECLSLQIRQLPGIPFVTRRMALTIVEQYLPLFAQREFNKLKKALDCDDEDLREAQAVIRQCNPHPGAMFATDVADAVVPDVIVKRGKNNSWLVELNQDVMPKLQLNSMYANILKNNRGDATLNSQLQEAKWLIKNMRQRFDTILRVSQAIVERQRNFFSHGAVAMRPLVLREIADT
ncbi:MAG: polymerase factor sigma-54, partial [Burkholderiaceae bacterium]|nr:polymerase factor sigma-54 [Burkholderiaceae bacterium]